MMRIFVLMMMFFLSNKEIYSCPIFIQYKSISLNVGTTYSKSFNLSAYLEYERIGYLRRKSNFKIGIGVDHNYNSNVLFLKVANHRFSLKLFGSDISTYVAPTITAENINQKEGTGSHLCPGIDVRFFNIIYDNSCFYNVTLSYRHRIKIQGLSAFRNPITMTVGINLPFDNGKLSKKNYNGGGFNF